MHSGERPSKVKEKLSIPGVEKAGIDAFYPKSFILTHGKDVVEFQKYFWLCHCQAYLSEFVAYYDSGRSNNDLKFVKEKIIVSIHFIKRSSQSPDDLIENGKHPYKSYYLTSEEMNFLGKDAYSLPYIKYIKNEEWYTNISRTYPDIRYRSKSKSKDDEGVQKCPVFNGLFDLAKDALKDLGKAMVQSKINEE